MDVKLEEILKAAGGEALGGWEGGFSPRSISTDTRTLEKGDVFFALKGPRFDGHDFLKEAYEKGARHFVVSETPKGLSVEQKKSSQFLRVSDTLKAYGDLAKFYRQKFKIPAVAITGSSGKTTVKELAAHVISHKFKVLKNRGTENNLVGVPKTIFQLEAAHEVLVLEMGTNAPGEINRLSSIAAPQLGIITQIGLAHLEGLKSEAGIREEKLSMIGNVERGGIVILNGQDPNMRDVACGVHKLVKAGLSKEADLGAEQLWCHENGSSFHVNGKIFETQLIGRHNVLNCLFAIAAGEALGLDTTALQKAIASFKPVSGRLFPKVIADIHFLDDSYNSNPNSFKAALETLKEFKLRERRGVVCGDMLELGPKSEALHREIGALMASFLFDFVIAAGPQCKFLVDEAVKSGMDPKKIHHAKDSAEAGRICREIAQPTDRILVKGSRGMQMEKVFECFITSSTR